MSSQALIEWLRRALRGFKKSSQDAARSDESGFTLVELLVVVAIMGVLAGIITPTVAHFANKGKTQAAATELQEVKAAIGADIASNAISQTDVWTPTSPVYDFTSIYLNNSTRASSTYMYPAYLSSPVSQTTSLGIVGYCWTNLGVVTQLTSGTTCP